MSTAVHASSENCPNCEAVVSGHFCSNCGQEAFLHHASTREFLHEFVGHYVALEGKLWGTVMRLLFRPGALTLEYIKGRRVRFVQPLRLYLTLSLIFFALMKFTSGFEPQGEPDAEKEAVIAQGQEQVSKLSKLSKAEAKISEKLKAKGDPQGAAAAEAAIAAMQKDVGTDIKDIGIKDKDRPFSITSDKDYSWLDGWPTLKHQFQAFEKLKWDEQKKVFKEGFYHYAPYAIFCLMPVFAMMLKVLYLGSGRRFGEHLLFALHTNAFAYFIFVVILLVPYTPVRLALWCWLLGYLPWAMRRVYHSSRWGVFLRWSTVMFFYSLCILVAVGLSMLGGIMTIGH
ncbi:MAG: DUF3667 domain-containing protein [Pseudomonadota bacterium]